MNATDEFETDLPALQSTRRSWLTSRPSDQFSAGTASMTISRMRVLYSFPHRIGAGRICTIAWYQVDGAAKAGAEVVALVGSVDKPLPDDVRVIETLARGRARIPYRAVGSQRMFRLHDRSPRSGCAATARRSTSSTSGRVERSRRSRLRARSGSRRCWSGRTRTPGSPTRSSKPSPRSSASNLPPDHEHAYKPDVLAREEAEFAAADKLLCPSEFTSEDLPRRRSPRRPARPPLLRRRPRGLPPCRRTAHERPVHGDLRRCRRRSKGPSLRTRGVAPLHCEPRTAGF